MFGFRFDTLAFAAVFTLVAAGCGDGSGSSASGGSTATAGSGGTSTGGAGGASTSSSTTLLGGAGGAWVMTLTSPTLAAGEMFPPDNTCAGLNVSPELDWTTGPPETKSYAVVLKDQTNLLVHSAIFDIPPDLLMLQADVDKDENPADVPGARQTKAYDNLTYGYLGPCPGGDLHIYKFTVFALDVSPLPIVGVPTKESVEDLAFEHALATGTLVAQSDASIP